MNCLARTVGIIAAMALLACPACAGAQQTESPTPANPAQARVALAPTAGADSFAARTSDTQRKPLNLRVPDVTKLFSQQELQRLLAKAIDPDIEEVEVQGTRNRTLPPPDTPTAWPGLLAPFWAITHPTQSWRIFAPLPPDQAQRTGDPAPDATDPYRPAVAPP